jgi:hypothetical protein
MTDHLAERLLATTKYQGFPVTRSDTDKTLLGDISRRGTAHRAQPNEPPALSLLEKVSVTAIRNIPNGRSSTSDSDPSPSDSPVHLDDEWDGSEDGILDCTSFVKSKQLHHKLERLLGRNEERRLGEVKRSGSPAGGSRTYLGLRSFAVR